ncbi:MAG: TetR/AcrR family transcriptional regulator [Chloroflexota bacterium]
MGRKSLAKERIEQILDAFEVCIRKCGFEGSSLAQIAKEAGVKRSIIRHYIGNRDAVVKALVERLIETYRQEMADAIASIPKDDFAPVLLDYLFLAEAHERPNSEILLDSLWAKQESDPHIKALLIELYEALEELLTDGLVYAYPQSDPQTCRSVAYSLICLLHTHTSLIELGPGHARREGVRQAAAQIVGLLEPA